ncbi:MAG: NAD(P)-binding domain-containing protein [Aquisalimonadaceae bacterium]
MRIGFLGLGVMGAGMVRNLIAHGFDLRVYDVVAAARDAFADGTCHVASSAADAADGVDALITILPDWPHVEAALLGPDGACERLPKGALVVDMSTISASESDRIAGRVREAGFGFVDSPLGRTPADAARGESLVIVGATDEHMTRLQPLFDAVGNKTVRAGGPGRGIRLKLVNNYMSTVGAVLAGEALTLANKAGIDRAATVEVLSNTTAGRGQLIVNFPNKVLAGVTTPDFPLRMAHKDVSHALNLGAEVSAPLYLGAIARETFGLAKAWGRENEDWTAALLLLEDIARAEHQEPIFPDSSK